MNLPQTALVSEDVSQPLVQASLLGEAIDRGPALVFVADEEMRYVAVNQYAADVLGYTRQELLNLLVSDVVPVPELPERFARFVARPEQHGLTTIRHKDGSEVSLRWASKQTSVAGLTLYVAVGFVEDAPG
jgi:PAS domain S-box-containing protein